MHVSIWQQFSSNHSANFEIVGTFKSEELAQQADEELRNIFRAIAKDRQAYEEYCHDCPPTPTEVAVAEKYRIAWRDSSIDWLVLDGDDVRNIVQVGEFVFVTNLIGDNTNMDAKPVDQLLRSMGADITVTGEYHAAHLTLDLSFRAPDEMPARRLHDEIKAYLDWPTVSDDDYERKGFVQAPWVDYWDGYELKLTTITDRSIRNLVQLDIEARERFRAEHAADVERLNREIAQADQDKDMKRRDRLWKELDPHLDYHYLPPENFSWDEFSAAHRAEFRTAPYSGSIRRDDRELTLTVCYYDYGTALAAIVSYLRANGCSDFRYKFSPKAD